jgi:hypothetical protein
MEIMYGLRDLDMEQRRLPVSDKRRQQLRDDRLWKREQQRAIFYNLKRIRCPCSKCKGGKLKYVSVERRLESGKYRFCWVILGEAVPISVELEIV